jgi:hypothetical protein
MSDSFDEVCRRHATSIRVHGPSSIHPTRFHEAIKEAIAVINELGFVTYDCQEGSPAERVYIRGFMRTERAHNFIYEMNLTSSRIAFYTVQSEVKSNPIVVRLNATGEDDLYRLYICRTEEALTANKKSVGLSKEHDVTMVVVMNAHWGFDAAFFDEVQETLRAVP